MGKNKNSYEDDLVVITNNGTSEKYLELVMLKLANMDSVRIVCMINIERYKKMEQVVGLCNRVGFIKKAVIKKVENKIGNKHYIQDQAILELKETIINERKYG